jgi:hypothetical protein
LYNGRIWRIASTAEALDPSRYLGVFRELPAAGGREPGDWCDVILHDELGEIRWMLVVAEVGEWGPPTEVTRPERAARSRLAAEPVGWTALRVPPAPSADSA